jgi:hypothetical protein
VASTPAHFWNPAYFSVKLIIAATVAWVSIVSLIPLLLLLGRAVPSFQPTEEAVAAAHMAEVVDLATDMDQP